ncbi:MAG: ParA family protein [Bacteroidales bacterium]|nr:ParA family protein [Bacteroidales bacterium]MBO7125630.1 ParA family protein [Bacteroidales bacterium]
MGKVIAIANQKGGVGKTTTCINLGASLAVLDYSVLIVDFDPQGNASTGLGIDIRDEKMLGVYECLAGKCKPQEAIHKYEEIEKLHIIPSNIDLVGLELELANDLDNRSLYLKSIIDKVRDSYDFVLIDCTPSLGVLTTNALTAADSVLLAIQCEYFALEGLAQLLNTIREVQENFNPTLSIEGFLITMYDVRLRLSNQVVEEVHNHFEDMLFETIIQRNVKLAEAPSFGKPVITYDAASVGAKNYLNLAQELLRRNKLPETKQ